jgi:hypothetical protein
MAPDAHAGMPLMRVSIFANLGVIHRKMLPKYGCGTIGTGAGAGGMITVWKSTPTTMSPIFTAGHNGMAISSQLRHYVVTSTT